MGYTSYLDRTLKVLLETCLAIYRDLILVFFFCLYNIEICLFSAGALCTQKCLLQSHEKLHMGWWAMDSLFTVFGAYSRFWRTATCKFHVLSIDVYEILYIILSHDLIRMQSRWQSFVYHHSSVTTLHGGVCYRLQYKLDIVNTYVFII